ncbi:MAG: imidazolonepropionase [Betaproteobacteria bacterium]|nr:imidazolonepropionase [Betaproteobacteria bacterium]
MHDALWLNANLATMAGAVPYGAIRGGALAVTDGLISWVGPRSAWQDKARREYDARGAWMTPGLVDCHTHLVYAGDRAAEFELRLKGASYEEIARAGGGIVSTVAQTRAASEDELVRTAQVRLRQWLAEGVAVVEVKSGYGLDRETELKMLRAARRLQGLTVKTTFLGAHALPAEFKDRADDYIDFVCHEVMPLAQADAVDAFCEGIGFSPLQVEKLFIQAKKHQLPVKLHADQLSDLGGAALAAKYRALSADHLEYTSEAGVRAMAAAGTVAVLLPGAFYFLREKQRPPVEALRRHGVPIALATDNNPGSAPLTSLLLTMNLGCTLFRLTPEEALAGVTRNGARALGMQATHGTLEVGKRADLALWQIDSPAVLAYAMGANPNVGAVIGGKMRGEPRGGTPPVAP